MKKRILPLLLALLMTLSLVPTLALASELTENKLQESHKNVYAGYDENNDTGLTTFELNNPLHMAADPEDPRADFSFWHFVDTGRKSAYAVLTFLTEEGEEVVWTVYSHKNEGQHYAVITPSGWKLADGVSFSEVAGNFVLSHSSRHEIVMGKVMAAAQVDQFYNEVIAHEDYRRDVTEYYERNVTEYYERDVEEDYERDVTKFLERSVTENYERDAFEIYGHHAQEFYVPVFTKKVISLEGTLVTRLTYSGTDVKAVPVNGGALKNGHTYVAVDVAAASAEGGVWYTIADSSKNNGKKTPAEYNVPIDYQYNVQIRDGQLTVSFGDDLVGASVGAYVVTDPGKEGKNFPGHAPAHSNDSVTVDLPKGDTDVVYLYTHIAALRWYAGEDVYEFVEWRLHDTKYGEYELQGVRYGEYELADTVYGEYELTDTQYGEYELVDTRYGEYELVNTRYGDYELADTQYGDYRQVKAWTTVKDKVAVPYEGDLTLTVGGEEKPLNEAFDLLPGTYEFVLSSSAFAPITKEVTIVPGDNGTVDFGTVTIQLEDRVVDTEKNYSDGEADVVKTDRTAVAVKTDREALVVKTDREALEVKTDREPEQKYTDREIQKEYVEEWIYEAPVYLGNDTDPHGEYAVIV